MCDKSFFEDPFMLKYCLDRYKTQEMCDAAFDDFLPALNLFPIGLLQVRWLKIFIVFHSQMMIYSFLMKVLVISNFLVNEIGILSVDLNNNNLDDNNFYEDDPETIIHVRLMAWYNRHKTTQSS